MALVCPSDRSLQFRHKGLRQAVQSQAASLARSGDVTSVLPNAEAKLPQAFVSSLFSALTLRIFFLLVVAVWGVAQSNL